MNTRSILLAASLLGVLLPAVAPAATGKPLKTGQTVSGGATGDTTAGIDRSYVDNGYGWVKDQRTGLMWEKKSDDDGIHDHDRAFTWSSSDGHLADGTVFTVFLATLNTPPCFAGYCVWRLPTSFELYTIEDLGRFNPSIDPAFDNNCAAPCTVTACSCTHPGEYWSSTTGQHQTGMAWIVGFTNGAVMFGDKELNYYARAVRNVR
ncbi:MAG: DUF1566 domain-containing protein [Alphaproteobacteria bacterium]